MKILLRSWKEKETRKRTYVLLWIFGTARNPFSDFSFMLSMAIQAWIRSRFSLVSFILLLLVTCLNFMISLWAEATSINYHKAMMLLLNRFSTPCCSDLLRKELHSNSFLFTYRWWLQSHSGQFVIDKKNKRRRNRRKNQKTKKKVLFPLLTKEICLKCLKLHLACLLNERRKGNILEHFLYCLPFHSISLFHWRIMKFNISIVADLRVTQTFRLTRQ